MAESVTVKHGDTITTILKTKRSVPDNEIHNWLRKIRPLNPHISSLDRIYPGDSVLLPASALENVPRWLVWQNAVSQIPAGLKIPYHGPTEIYIVQAGDTIDTVADFMFAGSPYSTMPASSKRALLIHNNPFLENNLATNQLPFNMLLNISPAVLNGFDKVHWQQEKTPLEMCREQMAKDTRDLFEQTGGKPAVDMARAVETLKSWGASVGTDDVIDAAAYGAAGVSGHAAAGTMALNNANALARELYSDAIETFGARIVHSKNANHLAQMQRFLRGQPKYGQLMRQLQELPQHLAPKGGPTPFNPHTNYAVARHFRKQISLPLKNWGSSSKYVGSVARQLNGKLGYFKVAGRHATWYVPAAIGLYNVYDAPAELRMRTLLGEGFGIIGGAVGTWLGGEVLGTAIVSALCLGPLGAFIMVFICASVAGIVLMKFSKDLGNNVYDLGNRFDGKIFHSPAELMDAIQ